MTPAPVKTKTLSRRSSHQAVKAIPVADQQPLEMLPILKPCCSEVLNLKPTPAVRQAAVHGIRDAIATARTATISDPFSYSRMVEWKVYTAHRRSIKLYRRAIGALIYNLSMNADHLCQAYPDPSVLASLGDVELGRGTAAEAFVKRNEESERKLLEINAGRGGLEECGKTMIRCHRKKGCKDARVDWSQLQTRGADEPITTLATCSNCGHTWNDS